MMKSGFYACLLAFGALAVAGCSGSAASTPVVQSVDGGANRLTPNAFGEVFHLKLTVVKKQPCIKHQAGGAAFKVRGSASGPYKGTLTGSGTWGFTHVGTNLWTFSETFKITGARPGDGTITGNGTGSVALCKTFGPTAKHLVYHLGKASGSATTTRLRNRAKITEKLL